MRQSCAVALSDAAPRPFARAVFAASLAAAWLLSALFEHSALAKNPAPPKPAGAGPAAKPGAATAQKPGAASAQKPAEVKKPELVASINGENVGRDELARECVKNYGPEVLESVLHKEMILDYCSRHQVTVTDKEVNAEIERMATKFKLPKEEWLKLLEKERNIKRTQYAKDIIWPSLALRKLAAPQLTVSKDELDKAYESQFGPAVKVRLIVLSNAEKARKVAARAAASPDDFPALARQNSEDSASASSGGMMPPMRRHLGDKNLERVAFALKPGQVSQPVEVHKQFVILKCEGMLAGTEVDRDKADPLLEEALKEGKLHKAAAEVFSRLQEEAKVVTVLGDAEKEKQMPGIAALINDRKYTIRELSEECIERHGTTVLEKILDRKLVEQALRKRNFAITKVDLDAEVARAALSMGQRKANGQADVEGWLKLVTTQQKITVETYLDDAVWPSVALKKLVGDDGKISDEDIRKGYEANYGPRVRCRAIILTSQRKAQEVWEKARDNPTLENITRLAKQYSSDTNSGSLGGEVPPIQRHGGQPLLEREAFGLKAGELSGVIQAGDSYVILFCEGYTKPIAIDMKEARQHILDDLQEKKQRISMAKTFERLQDAAQIDNYLAGTIKSPKNSAAGGVVPASALIADQMPESAADRPAARGAAKNPQRQPPRR